MTNSNKIPIPKGTGSSGEQETATELVLPEEPQTGIPVVEAIEKGLASSRRALGEFASTMLAGVARQLANDNEELKVKNRQLRRLLDNQRDELEKQRIGNAILTTKLESEQGSKHSRNFGIAVGTALVSAGLFRFSATNGGYSWALIVGGALLLLVSWFSPIKRTKNTSAKGNQS